MLALFAGAWAGAEAPPGYRLVWSDEFNLDGPPDPAKWGFEHGFERNHEAQWYQANNAVCRSGLLVIEGRRERVANPSHDPHSKDWRKNLPHAEYTSSSLVTRGKFAWQYGVLEVRAKIDARPGLWPAIWTVGKSGGWPDCGEVDVMEYYQHSLLANACWRATPRTPDQVGARREGLRREGHVMWDGERRPMEEIGDPQWAESFHLWRMDWTAERIRLWVDDRLMNEIDLSQVKVQGDRPDPFRQPHYLLLNLAIGGQQGGDPSATEFPARFEVDYARVYQR